MPAGVATISVCPIPTTTARVVDVAADELPADLRADDETSDAALLSNGALAQVFHEIGDLLEVKGELVFKTVAYHRAADAIGRSPVEVARAYREGHPPDIPGVGKAIADKLAELASDRPARLSRAAPGRVPADAPRHPPCPRAGAQDRPAALHEPRHRDPRRAPQPRPSRAGCAGFGASPPAPSS